MVRKYRLILLTLALGLLLLKVNTVSASQLISVGFEGFSMTSDFSSPNIVLNGTYQTVYSTSISLPSPKYLSGMYLVFNIYSNDSTDYMSINVYVNGVLVASKTWISLYSTITRSISIPLNGHYNSTFNIKIEAKAGSAASAWMVRLNTINAYFYFMNEDYAINSTMTELKYIPPGADNTATALVVNQTEVLLPKTYTLKQGAIAFWLKWDGTKSIMLSDNIGIDSNGYLFVKSSTGTTYTLEGVSPPIGKYVPVYIGWTESEGYIMINATKIALNWAGNLTISRIGDINNKSATLIDEFKVWDTYIPSDQIVLASQTQEYHILLSDGKAIAIAPEGGVKLGLIDVTFLGKNYTALNTTMLGPSSSLAIAPNGTAAVAISRAGISRIYWLGNYTTIAFLAEDAKLIVTHVTVTPEQFDYLVVKTISGQVATRIKLQNNQGDFVAIPGAQYIFTFEKGNITRSRVYTVTTSNLVFYLTTSKLSLQPPLDFQAYYDQKTRLVFVVFEDAGGTTKWLNITMTGYQNYAPTWRVHDFENRTYGLYILTANATDTDYVRVMLTANINGSTQTFERTVYVGTYGANRAPFPTSLVPPAIVMLTAALLGIFIFPGTAPALMLLGGATSLGILTILGWIPAMPGLITTLTLLGVLALIIYRRG